MSENSPDASSSDDAAEVAPAQNSSAEEMTSAPKSTCQNCGTRLHGDYCHNCGQRHISRLQFRTLMLSFADAILNVADLGRGLWSTIREGARNPGRLARRYVEGERQSFINPISYILVAITLLFLAYMFFRAEFVEGLTEMYRVQLPAMGTDPEEAFAPDGGLREVFGWQSIEDMARGVLGVLQQTQTYISLLYCLLAAGLLRAAVSGYTYAEMVVFELYVVAQAILLHVVTLPIFLFAGTTTWFLVIGIPLQLGVHVLAGRGFFGAGWKGWLLPPLAYVGSQVVALLISVVIGFLIGFAVAFV
jgi:hypothetical protein